MEKPAADFVGEFAFRVDAERRKAAVAGYLRGDALLDEGRVIHLRVVVVVEEVVVRMRVDEAGCNGKTACVDGDIGVRAVRHRADRGYSVAVHKQITVITR